MPLLVAILLLLTLVPFALFRGSQVPEAEAAWWDNSWRYRKSIQVTNNTTEQSNVYISLTLDTSDTTKFQEDCGDLRFTKQNGQVLPYYIASGCGTASTSVHVQLDTFPAGAQTLYAYYGNPSAPNGFANNDFLMEATNYTVGGTGGEETAPGPVAYWKFDEGQGQQAHDSSGNNDVTLGANASIGSDDPTWVAEDQCVSGTCLQFDEGDFTQVTASSTLKIANKTVSFWARPTTNINSTMPIVSLNSANWYVGFAVGNKMITSHSISAGAQQATYSGDNAAIPNQWNFYTYIFTVSESNVSIKMYRNGNLVKLSESTSGYSSDYGATLYLGAFNSSSSRFIGLIDEVKIFPYALSENEIKAEYNLGAAAVIGTGPAAPPPEGGNLDDSLVAHWAFDEQAGQTVHDRVGGNDGSLGADTNPGNDDPAWRAASECKVNGCLGFDGVDDYSAIPDFNAGRNSTLTGWFRLDGSNSARYLFGGSGGFQRVGVFNGSNMLGFFPGYEEGGGIYLYGSTNLNDGQWHHVAFIDTESPRTRTMYIDGKVEIESAPLQIGTGYGGDNILKRISGNYGAFRGLIDEVKIYNTALTPEQVLQDMNAGASLTVGMGANEADEIIDGAGDPPIAEWKFDEKQGTTAYDTSGNENNGTVNGATWKSACKQGACLEFDGVDDLVAISTNNSTTLTVSAWVKSRKTKLLENYLSGAGISTYASIHSSRFQIYDGVSWRSTTTPIDADTWYHLTYSFDGATKELKMYVNGSLEYTGTSSTYSNGSVSLIGGSTLHSDRAFGGQIDHVRIYDYVRTPAQIAYDYNRGKPIAHWKFDECEGTVAHDSSGNDNHGTINIGPSGSQSTAGTCQTSGAWANGKDGKFNGSLNFDGIDDYVELDSARLSFERTSPFSIGLWMKPAALTTNTIFSKQLASSPYTGYALWLLSNGSVKFEMFNSTGSTMHSSAGTLVTGKWQHILITYDGSGSSADVNIYINGNPESTSDSGSISGSITNSVAPQIMGREGPNRVSSGQIDDVRVYNYVLSPAQVRKVMNEGVALRFGPAN